MCETTGDLAQMSVRLRYGSAQQRVLAWQKLVSLDQTGLEGVKVANSGLVPVLVAMVEQIPSRRKSDVQNQAASLLLEAAASDVGMEVLMSMDCIPRLTTALQSGSFIKRARVTAVLGMISKCSQYLQTPYDSAQCSNNTLMLASSSVPEVIRVLAEAGCASAACTPMLLEGLSAMLADAASVSCFVQAGGLQVLSKVLMKLSRQASTPVLSSSSDDDDRSDGSEWSEDNSVWLAAMSILNHVTVYSVEGCQMILQGPVLCLLMQCCSSSSWELQLSALTALLALADAPCHWPPVVKAGQAFHLATAMHSTNLAVQHQALKCIKVLMPVLTRHDEQLLITALESLMGGVEDSNSVTGESLDSCGEGDSDSDMEI